MTTSSKILVLGAGGTVGTCVSAEMGDLKPRLAFHTPAKAERAKAQGHDAVLVDLGSPASLAPAMDGVDRVFLVSAAGPEQERHECAVVDAAKTAGIRKIVKLSGWGADAEAIGLVKVHRAIERVIERSGLAFTFLRPNGFMQNFINHMGHAIRTDGVIRQPAANARVSHIDVRDIARVAARVLVAPEHDGQVYDLSGPAAITYGEAAEVLTRVLGKPVRYLALSDGEAKAALMAADAPAAHAEALVEMFRHYRSGAGESVSPAVQAITGRAPTSFEQFARDHASAFAGA